MPTFDKKPATFFPTGYNVDPGNHLLSLNTSNSGSPLLLDLTDVQADPTNGDARQVILAIQDAIFQAVAAQVVAGNTSAKMALTRSVTSDTAGNIVYNFTSRFTLANSTPTVAAE